MFAGEQCVPCYLEMRERRSANHDRRNFRFRSEHLPVVLIVPDVWSVHARVRIGCRDKAEAGIISVRGEKAGMLLSRNLAATDDRYAPQAQGKLPVRRSGGRKAVCFGSVMIEF
jgi:hypothetical protein